MKSLLGSLSLRILVISGISIKLSCTHVVPEESVNCRRPLECEREGYVQNPNDCRRYYECVDYKGGLKNFTIYEFDCKDGGWWDEDLQICQTRSAICPPPPCSRCMTQMQNPERDAMQLLCDEVPRIPPLQAVP